MVIDPRAFDTARALAHAAIGPMGQACVQTDALAKSVFDAVVHNALAAPIAAMHKFCDRVEAGEARSRRTYAEFCELLGRPNKQVPAPAQPDYHRIGIGDPEGRN